MEVDKFTLSDWINREEEPFSVDPAVAEELNDLMERFTNLAIEHKIPFVCHFVERSDMDVYGITTSAYLASLGRVPRELLMAYVAGTHGFDDAMHLGLNLTLGTQGI